MSVTDKSEDQTVYGIRLAILLLGCGDIVAFRKPYPVIGEDLICGLCRRNTYVKKQLKVIPKSIVKPERQR
jgi:hypothetical protein